MRAQAKVAEESKQGDLVGPDDSPLQPAQLACSTWRVNDYDLQIQHIEAVALACEHLGVPRTRSDSWFDGTLGKRLARGRRLHHGGHGP